MEQASDKQVIESQKKIINQLTLEKAAIITKAKNNEKIVNIQGNLIKELRQQIAVADDRKDYEVNQEREEAKGVIKNIMEDYDILDAAFLKLEKENTTFREMMNNLSERLTKETEKLEKANRRIAEDDDIHQEQITELEEDYKEQIKNWNRYYADKINEMNSFYKEKLEVAKRALESSMKTAKKALKNIEWKDKSSFKTDNIKLHF